MENAKGVPVLQQHGEIDDNVPAYNSRLLGQQLFQTGTDSSYHEFPGQNHWWDGVMTTEPLVSFYREQTASTETIPRRLDNFSIVIGDPGDTGPKCGIRVLNLEDPGQYGRINVQGRVITTSNVLSLEFDPTAIKLSSVVVDGNELDVSGSNSIILSKPAGTWQVG